MSELDTEQKSSRRLWMFAAIGALALHAGGAALAFAHLKADDLDEAVGAPAIEIGLEMTSPRVQPTDLPAGPDTEASVASPAMAEQKAEVKETELPKDVPTESENPDRAVMPNDKDKPKEDDAKMAAVQTQASTESEAVEATATPSSENIPQAMRSVAPAQGTGESAQRVRATWQKELMAHLDKHKRYPASSQRTAEIVVSFALDRRGHVLSTSIVKGSGDTALDEAALAMVRKSDPVPPPPPAVADEGLNFTLPVIFKVKGRS
jgi:periplasmic protein TonB